MSDKTSVVYGKERQQRSQSKPTDKTETYQYLKLVFFFVLCAVHKSGRANNNIRKKTNRKVHCTIPNWRKLLPAFRLFKQQTTSTISSLVARIFFRAEMIFVVAIIIVIVDSWELGWGYNQAAHKIHWIMCQKTMEFSLVLAKLRQLPKNACIREDRATH